MSHSPATSSPIAETIVLGRSDKSDLRIDDPSITRLHAKLHLAGGERIEIEDLRSVNGTRMRDRRLEPGSRASLLRGEVFRLGSALLVIHAVEEASPLPSSAAVTEDTRPGGTARPTPAAPPSNELARTSSRTPR